MSANISFVRHCRALLVVELKQATFGESAMSAVSSILRWLDGESPASSSRDDSQVMSSESKADDIPDEGALMQSPSGEIATDSAHPDHSSVLAIEADLMEVSSKAVHAVRDWGSEC